MSKKRLPTPAKRSALPSGFADLLTDLKVRIQQAQTRAVLAANAELVRLYWDVGRMIDQRQQQEGWGTGVIPRLALELKNELPEVKGFSERNIGRMIAFFRSRPQVGVILPQAAAKLPSVEKVPQAAAQIPESVFWSIPWFHHVILVEKVKDPAIRQWYMQQTLANGWSRNVLAMMIDGAAHRRQGQAVTRDSLLPRLLSGELGVV